jgi:hypothetical protein
MGANAIRSKVHLATNAVVVLYRLCYASGNAEQGMRPELPSSARDRNVATERVDNFAAGFLSAGAGAVFAWGWPQKINLPHRLATTNETMDRIFMDRANHTGSPNAFIGSNDYYRSSKRTVGARIHLDPHRVFGHLRALSGNLRMSAAAFRGQAAAPAMGGSRATVLPAGVRGAMRAPDAGLAALAARGESLEASPVVSMRRLANGALQGMVSPVVPMGSPDLEGGAGVRNQATAARRMRFLSS